MPSNYVVINFFTLTDTSTAQCVIIWQTCCFHCTTSRWNS